MPTPSNRSGIPTVPVVALLALILFLGLFVAPRAFEFRAWPEPARPGAVEEIVSRSAEPVVEVPVARVKTRRDDTLAVRGRNPRKASPSRSGRAGDREPARAGRAGRRSRGSRSAPSAQSAPPSAVEEPPASEPVAPVNPPEQPAQLAEGPRSEVLRLAAEVAAPRGQAPAPLAEVPLVDVPFPSEGKGHKGRGCGNKRD